jgi:aminoglycoside phosphotransferase (APT) family kinase protein
LLLLLRYLGEKVPYLQDLTVSSLLNRSDGWECEVYSFELGFTDKGVHQSKPMILRLYPGREMPGVEPKAVREFNTLCQLAEYGYPVPQVYLLECDSEHLGSPFIIMERIDGERLDHLCTSASQVEREALLREMCELMVRLHNLD